MRLQPPDCGDNSCYFAERRGGMRTNGGCRCGDERKQGPGSLSWYARQLKAENAKLRAALVLLASDSDDTCVGLGCAKLAKETLAAFDGANENE